MTNKFYLFLEQAMENDFSIGDENQINAAPALRRKPPKRISPEASDTSTDDNMINFLWSHIANPQGVTGIEEMAGFLIHTGIDQDILRLKPRQLTNETRKFDNTEQVLYEACARYINIPNSHRSELFFAIVYGGTVIGREGGEVDVTVGGTGVSLKAYASQNRKSAVYDIGAASAMVETLKKKIKFLEVLSGQSVNASMTRKSLQQIITTLQSDKFKNAVAELKDHQKELSQLSHIFNNEQSLLGKLMSHIDALIKGEDIAKGIVNDIDTIMASKLDQAPFWAFINTSAGVIRTSDNESLYYELNPKTKNDEGHQIPQGLDKIKGGNIFIKINF